MFGAAPGLCQHCKESSESVGHFASHWNRMLGIDYTCRHNEVVKCMHLLLCNKYNIKRTWDGIVTVSHKSYTEEIGLTTKIQSRSLIKLLRVFPMNIIGVEFIPRWKEKVDLDRVKILEAPDVQESFQRQSDTEEDIEEISSTDTSSSQLSDADTTYVPSEYEECEDETSLKNRSPKSVRERKKTDRCEI
ncbi:hypothetical protein ACJJTC_017403 [Scirpophaga incertulas]